MYGRQVHLSLFAQSRFLLFRKFLDCQYNQVKHLNNIAYKNYALQDIVFCAEMIRVALNYTAMAQFCGKEKERFSVLIKY